MRLDATPFVPRQLQADKIRTLVGALNKLVKIKFRNPDDDWEFFIVRGVSNGTLGILGNQVHLRGADYPDGFGKHVGDEFWTTIDEIVKVEEWKNY